MSSWLDDFKRDAFPSHEIEHWERVAAVYREYVTSEPLLDARQRSAVFDIVQTMWIDDKPDVLEDYAGGLPAKAISILRKLYRLEISSSKSESNAIEGGGPVVQGAQAIEKEKFPTDWPNDLLNELL